MTIEALAMLESVFAVLSNFNSVSNMLSAAHAAISIRLEFSML